MLKLIGQSEEDALNAFQIAFDLVDKESQTFTTSVLNHLTAKAGECEEKARLEKLRSILKGEIRDRLYQ